MFAHAQGSAPTLSPPGSGDLQSILAPHPATLTGQAATQLPNGSWLMTGGQSGGVLALPIAVIVDTAGKSITLSAQLVQARANHSATLLPSGVVLILGGTDAKGNVISTAEQFDPASGVFTSLGNLGLIARTGHTTTVLSSGQIMIAGGNDAYGHPLFDVELYNPACASCISERFNAKLDVARLNQVAALLPNSTVLLWGSSNAQVLNTGDLADPGSQSFSIVTSVAAMQMAQSFVSAGIPSINASQPSADAQGVGVDQPLMVRFSQRMAMSTFNTATVTLLGPNGPTAIKSIPVEYGVLLFVTPQQNLLPGTHYTLFIDGATDQSGQALPFTAIGFTTGQLGGASATGSTSSATSNTSVSNGTAAAATTVVATIDAAATTSVPTAGSTTAAVEINAGSVWIPKANNYHGQWRSEQAILASRTPPRRIELQRAYLLTAIKRDGRIKLQDREAHLPAVINPSAAPGVTALVGQALKLNGQPLSGVTVSMGNQSTVTDDNGEFLLTNIPSGEPPGQSPVLQIDGRSASTVNTQYGRYFYQIHVKAGKVNGMRQPIWMVQLDTSHAIQLASPTTMDTVISNPLLPGLEVHLPAGAVIRDADGKIVTQVSLTPVPSDQLPFPMPYGELPVYYTLQPGGAVIQSVTGKPLGAKVIYPNYSTQQAGAHFELFDYDPAGRGWYVYGDAKVSSDGKKIVSDKDFILYQFTGSSAASSGGPGGNGPGGCGSVICACPQGGTGGDPVSCHDGLFVENNTDFEIADVTPLSLQRSYHSGDLNQHSFGVGAAHSYDLYLYFPPSQGGPYTEPEIDLVLGNGGSIPFTAVGTNTDYIGGAVYQSLMPGQFYMATIATTDYDSNFLLTLKDGTVYVFGWYESSLAAIQDRFGNNTGITRDDSGRIALITSPSGRIVSFQYSSTSCASCITQATDNLGRQVNYQYDSAGHLTQVTDVAGGITTRTILPRAICSPSTIRATMLVKLYNPRSQMCILVPLPAPISLDGSSNKPMPMERPTHSLTLLMRTTIRSKPM